jgi:hypothetical protein
MKQTSEKKQKNLLIFHGIRHRPNTEVGGTKDLAQADSASPSSDPALVALRSRED